MADMEAEVFVSSCKESEDDLKMLENGKRHLQDNRICVNMISDKWK